MRYVGLLVLALLGFDQFRRRDTLAERRNANRRWRETNRALSWPERREVARAVRNGEATADPGLRRAAAEKAAAILGVRRQGPAGWAALVLSLAWFVAAPILIASYFGEFLAASVFGAFALLLVGAVAWSLWSGRNAEAALAANR